MPPENLTVPSKKGLLTTELWTSIGATVSTIGIATTDSDAGVRMVALAVLGVVTTVFIWSRTAIKKETM